MAKYLIESTHDSDKVACDRAIRSFLKSGSHFVTNSEWGCDDSNHTAWLIVDVESKDDAMMIVPPEYRKTTKITLLKKYTIDNLSDVLSAHA